MDVGCVKECFCACPCWFSLCAVVCLLRGRCSAVATGLFFGGLRLFCMSVPWLGRFHVLRVVCLLVQVAYASWSSCRGRSDIILAVVMTLAIS